MNSKDRRKHNRKFPFTVDIKREFPPVSQRVPESYYKYGDIGIWCDEQFGKKNWERQNATWYHHTYKFKLEKHMLWFMMRWS
jgi:hypothetical protein